MMKTLADMRRERDRAPSFWMYGLGATVGFCFLGYTCTQADDLSAPVRALESSGFSNVKVEPGHVLATLHGCGHDDALAYQASATNSAGKRVSVVVCCGAILKSCTVRVP